MEFNGDDSMYDFIDNIVRITKNDGSIIVGFVDDCETDYENYIGDAMSIDTDAKTLPYIAKPEYTPETVFIKDIKSIQVIY